VNQPSYRRNFANILCSGISAEINSITKRRAEHAGTEEESGVSNRPTGARVRNLWDRTGTGSREGAEAREDPG
jgi:hypothetical protein